MARKREQGGWTDSNPHKVNVRMNSHAWKQRVRRAKDRARRDDSYAVCWLCGEPIDMDLPPRHARSFTLDHLIPLEQGGDLDGEAKPAHLSCNSSRGDGRRRPRRATPPTVLSW